MKVAILNEDGLEYKEIADELDTYYSIIGTNCIDIVERTVYDITFDIICDDEGLLKDAPRVSAFDRRGKAMLVGNLIFCHHDEEGEMTGITAEEFELLNDNLGGYIMGDGRAVPAMLNVEY